MTTPLTKGELRVIAETDHVQCGDAAAMAKMLLEVMDGEPDRNPVLAYADSYRDMAKQGIESVQIWSVITDLERNIAPLYRHAQPATVVPGARETFESFMAKQFGGTVNQQRAKNGDRGYIAWDMVVAWMVWQHCAAMLQAGSSAIASADDIDTLALDAATDIMEAIASSREAPLPGGDTQMLARIQCRIAEACRKTSYFRENTNSSTNNFREIPETSTSELPAAPKEVNP